MTSTMLTGEKRWATARRGTMTVLGKVAVPKPINLPSQRLENHGLDPNVEIVPKGTHSWGSRSSSASSNAWGSTSLSPNTDGGASSPSHLSGRPSSAGTGTRPSTAGSERAHDPINNAWGPNSRPSSSSGVITSNQTSHAALLSRSAETRPGSSQLSRFAEPLSDTSPACRVTGTVEKLEVAASKNDGFSLTSGDFPTLGSEKESLGKNIDSQDYGSHGRPGSSSGVTSGKEMTRDSTGDVLENGNGKIGVAGSWRKENVMYGEEGARSNVEKWHVDPQPFSNPNIPPQHYDGWRGPPVNNHPGGVWYRGPPGGPPFGSPVPAGGFPIEPFPYFRPQIPPHALANPQPRGPHPKNGDMFRPHMHDAYIRPGMPLRPGFYPGPVHYDRYYGPPMGYCNSNERDSPFMGMAMGPAAYSMYPGHNVPDPGNSHGRSGGYGSNSKTVVSEQVEAVHFQDSQGPYKVLLKHHDNWEGNDDEQKWDDSLKNNVPYPLKGEHPRKSWENGWRADNKDDEMDARRMMIVEGTGTSSEVVDDQIVSVKMRSSEQEANVNAYDGSSGKKFEHPASPSSEVLGAPRESSLIQKIEGLNAKARASDGRQCTKSVSSMEEQSKMQVGNSTASHSVNVAGTDSFSNEMTRASGVDSPTQEDCSSAGDKSRESAVVSGTALSRRSTHGIHGRGDHRGKGRFDGLEVDGWRKKHQVIESKNAVSALHDEASSLSHGQHQSVPQPSTKNDSESVPPVSDSSDSQLTKMRELAKRREEREKEEEERTREQRAKARAKLEELNRRTQTGEGATQKLENASTSSIQNKRDESLNLLQPAVVASKPKSSGLCLGSNVNATAEHGHGESIISVPPSMVTGKSRAITLALDASPKAVASSTESSVSKVEKSTKEMPKIAHDNSVALQEQLESVQYDGYNADAAQHSGSVRVHDGNASKQKRSGYRQKHNTVDKNTMDKPLSTLSAIDTSNAHPDVAVDVTVSSDSVADESIPKCESNLPVNHSAMVDSLAYNRRKNRGGKSKHKAEALTATSPPSIVSKDSTTSDTLVENSKPKTSETMSSLGSHLPQADLDATQSLELCSSLTNEDTHIRTNNQWKSHHPRRMVRNPQANKSAEKNHNGDAVVWAPVRSQNKTEVSDEDKQNNVSEAVVLSSKTDQQVQNSTRNKRAEMERYIPKPVAKELSQQAAVALSNLTNENVESPRPLSAESSHTFCTVTGKMVPSIESRNVDGKLNKSGKVHGSWRQRGVTETAGSSGSNQNATGDQQHQKSDSSSIKEHPRHPDEGGASDGWNILENHDTAVDIPVLKDQGVVSRGKRQPHKGHKATGYYHNPDEKRTREKVYVESTGSETHQKDSSVTLKENIVVGEQSTSHWQPKHQSFSSTNQRGSQPNSGANIGPEGDRVNKKGSSQGVGLLPQPDKGTDRPHTHFDQFLSGKSNLGEVSSAGHESKRERKMGGQRGRHGSPIESSSHSSMDVRQDQRLSSGYNRSGNSGHHFGREHDSRGDWNGSGKDVKQQHNVPAMRERRRQNSHYEYQPVGSHNNSRTNSFEAPKEGSHNYGGRHREKGQTRRSGGNFYGRQTGSVQVDAGFE